MKHRFNMNVLFAALLISATSFTLANDDDEQCGLYLAVSSTSTVEEPKWGLYAGKEYQPKDLVGFPDIAIQTFTLLGNAVVAEGDDHEQDDDLPLTEIVEYFEQFIWVPQSSGGQFEMESGRIVTAIPGAGVLGGYNPKLTNADWNHSIAYFREAWNEYPGVAHPGRGAYTNYYQVALQATNKIPAGMEIFVNYGDNWDGEEETEDDEEKITKDDHAKIDETIDKMLEFFQKHEGDLDEAAKADIYDFLVRDVMGAAAGPVKGAKITALLPPTADQLQNVKDAGGSLTFSEPTAVRPADWLKQYGRCMDNIKPGPSTIPYAGRGAFANRKIYKDGLISPMPMVQIPNESIMDMHEIEAVSDDDGDYFVRANNVITGQQLLLNYCFGHSESSMILFPSGAIAPLINHSDEPNAKLIWSKHPNNHRHWFELSPEELLEESNAHIGLLMEVVALRDIEEGEEIFLDYGSEWKEAWMEHVRDWNFDIQHGQRPAQWPVRAMDLNAYHHQSPIQMPFKTTSELIEEPGPANVMLKCFLLVQKPKDEPPKNEFGQKVRIWVEPDADLETTFQAENLFDCKIVQRTNLNDEDDDEEPNYMYTVEWGNGVTTTIVKEVPHRACLYFDKPGTSDQHEPEAFRHYIGIPDEIFPEAWRDLEDVSDDDDDDDDDDEED